MRTFAIVNQKGGCGKTTTAINLGAFLALADRKTLIVDMDPQGHSTLGLLTNHTTTARTMYERVYPTRERARDDACRRHPVGPYLPRRGTR